ncbi:MAG: acylneuraminate cytidylyltransferase family protein, partial [Saprospiraceae bacterium]|nr:acylneuraminate cytidylyltransferase family protein [Saprospiraceae bacterium]
YSIAAAAESSRVSRIVCSTDDEKIARIASSYGADVPFIRPAPLSGDKVTDFPVIEHALIELMKSGEEYDLVVHLRPTSPFRPPGLIDKAIKLMIEKDDCDSLRSMSKPLENPFKMWQVKEGSAIPLIDLEMHESYNQPRQKLPEVYWHDGILDVIRTKTIFEKKSVTGDSVIPLITKRAYALDLDDLWQWKHAEMWVEESGLEYVSPE